MLGRSHAISGAAAWLAGSAIAAHYGHHQPAAQVAIGAVLCAGGALQPDWDVSGRVISGEGGATVAKTFGVVSLFLAECAEKAGLAIYNATKRRSDPDRDNGHRLFFHGAPWNVAAGFGIYALCAHFGRLAVLPVLFFMTACALRAVLGGKQGWLLLNAAALAVTVVAYRLLPHGTVGFRLLGLAVGVGAVVHLCGDALTEHGTVFLAPITWHAFGLPKVLRCRTGKGVETAWAVAFTLVAVASAVLLAHPAFWPSTTHPTPAPAVAQPTGRQGQLMAQQYTTTVTSTGWTCDCPSPYIPAPGDSTSARQAGIEGENHAEYYEARGWPHRIQRR